MIQIVLFTADPPSEEAYPIVQKNSQSLEIYRPQYVMSSEEWEHEQYKRDWGDQLDEAYENQFYEED